MSPEAIRSKADKIHRDFTVTVEELVKAAEEINSLTCGGYNPTLDEILMPMLFTPFSEDIDDERTRSYLRMMAI